MRETLLTISILPCSVCGDSEPLGDTHNDTCTFTMSCGNTDCSEYNTDDGEKKTRLQAIQAWNNRQKSMK